jgi:hypothetical protein
MSELFAALVCAACLALVVLCYVRVRRIERDVDLADLHSEERDDKTALLARVVANMIVASP